MTITTREWDTSEYLDTPEVIHEYLKAAIEEGDIELMITAIGNVAKAKGMTEIAKQTNMNRQNLYKAFSPNGSPKFETVVKVLHAFNFKLTVEPI
ncbi:MAG: putative addiction module antidote protein [Desulfamplus sp.]|nr:putative addiction module antidote protein [Desulfamplus sp.]